MEEAGSFVRSAVDGHLGRLQDALSGSTLSDAFCSQPLASVHIYVDGCASYLPLLPDVHGSCAVLPKEGALLETAGQRAVCPQERNLNHLQ